MRSVIAEGRTVIIAEHRLYFASDLIDRAILVEKGRIVREFSPEELLGLSSEEREGMGLRAVGAGDALDVCVPRAAMDNRTEAGLALDDYTVVRGRVRCSGGSPASSARTLAASSSEGSRSRAALGGVSSRS